MAHVYHWKHGWIPLDHVALKRGGHRTQATSPIKGATKSERSAHHPNPETGIRNQRDLAKAIEGLHALPEADKPAARREIRAAGKRLGVPGLTGQTLASGDRVNTAQNRVAAAQARLDAANAAVAAHRASNRQTVRAVETSIGPNGEKRTRPVTVRTGLAAGANDNTPSAAGRRQAEQVRASEARRQLAAADAGAVGVDDNRVSARQDRMAAARDAASRFIRADLKPAVHNAAVIWLTEQHDPLVDRARLDNARRRLQDAGIDTLALLREFSAQRARRQRR